MTLEIRLLGTVEARRDGRALTLGGDPQRRLLACLALQPGRTRTTDAIATALWPADDLPADPHQTIRTYVSRLRTSLGDGDSILLRDGGYRLAVDETAVDVRRFEVLVRQATDPAATATSTLALLDDALALWSGPPLDGYEAEEWARPDAVRLAELRAAAIDDRADVLVRLGRHDQAIAELRAAVVTSPLRERTHRVLMVALHRAGRQAEALRVYRTYRQGLATELGLEPSETIRALEAAIATGSLAVDVSTDRALHAYELLEPIGEGSSSIVYRAVQPSVQRAVAVKAIRPATADDPEFVRRFEAEAQLVARLEHPHIVPIYDYWREPGAAYIVMRLYPNTLEQRLSDGPCPPDEALRLISQVGGALSAAHRLAVIHGDIKPANIFVDAAGSFFLGDFGIATDLRSAAESPLRSPTRSTASLMFASPEQRRREPLTPATDVYGLGMVLHHALARTAGDPIDPRIEAVVTQATAEAVAARFGSVDDLVAAAAVALGAPATVDATATADRRNPYKGLRAFQEADAPDFFGRRRIVDRLLHATRQDANRFVMVVGPSGSGKSSVVRAGLIPSLRTDDPWGRRLVTSMIPGSRPFEALESALGRIATSPLAVSPTDPEAIARAVRLLAPDEDGELVLVIDQFEELFTACTEATRAGFLDGLLAALGEDGARLRVVATLRADFYDQPLRHRALAATMEEGLVTLSPPSPAELESAIVEPARQVGVGFEPGLCARIAGDVGDQPGALPLLQYALTELFDRGDADVLTIEAYEQIGGLGGAVARRAELIYAASDDEDRLVTRRLFMRLVNPGERTGDTRRRVRITELGGAAATRGVLERYGAARLLAFDHDPRTREPVVELAHEALIDSWPRLHEWLDEDRDGVRLHRDLTERAAAWVEAQRDDGELYRGARLVATEQWSADHADELNADEAEFVAASTAQRHREVEREQRVHRRTLRSLVAVAIVAVIALLAGAIAWHQQGRAREAATEADRQRDAAQTSAFVAETGRLAALSSTLGTDDPVLAMLLAAEAARRQPGPEAWGALQQALVAADATLGYLFSDAPIRKVRFDGDRVVGVSTDAVTVWDARTHQQLERWELPVPVAQPRYAGDPYDPISMRDGLVAWVAEGATAYVMELGGEEREVLHDADNVLISDDGEHLAAATLTGDVTLFRLPSLEVVWTAPGDGTRNQLDGAVAVGITPPPEPYASLPVLTHLRISPDGSTLVQSRYWYLRSLDLRTGTVLGSTVLRTGAAAMEFERVEPHRIVTLGLHALIATSLPTLEESDSLDLGSRVTFEDGFTPLHDGRIAVQAVAGHVTTVRFGDGPPVVVADRAVAALADSPAAPSEGRETIEAHIGSSGGLDVSPDGAVVAIAGESGVALVSANGGGLLRRTVPRTADHVYWVAGGDASWVVSGSPIDLSPPYERSAARVFRCPPSQACAEVTTLELDGSHELAGDPRADLISIFGYRWGPIGRYRFIDAQTLERRSVDIDPNGLTTEVVAADPDARWVMTVPSEPALEVLELPSGRLLARLPLESDWGDVNVTPLPSGEEVLVMSGTSGASYLLDTETWTRRESPVPDGEAAWATFSGDGTLAATADQAGQVTIRDATTFAALRRLSVNDELSPWFPMAFSDDGRFLVTVHAEGGRLWDVGSGQLIGQLIPTLANSAPLAVHGEHAGLITATTNWVQVWDFDVDRWAAVACRAAGRNLTQQEWEQFGPRDEPYRVTCPEWPPAGA